MNTISLLVMGAVTFYIIAGLVYAIKVDRKENIRDNIKVSLIALLILIMLVLVYVYLP